MPTLVKWLIALVIVAAVLGGLTLVGVQAMAIWAKQMAPRYLTATVSRGSVETIVNSTGTIKPVHSVSVGAFVSGPIEVVLVDFNSVVKKGQLLARIDPRLLAAAAERDKAYLDTQKADLNRIEALLQQAANNEKRAEKLLASGKDFISGMELDQYHFTRLSYEAQRKLAIASIAQAEATLRNSQANLDYADIRSPVDGVVIERKVDPGQTVASSFQTPELFVVAPDMDKHMHVFGSVDEADIGMVRSAHERGQVVHFTVDAYPGELFEGKVYQIRKSSTTVQNVVTYPVVIEAANPGQKLLPGMTATITFHIDDKTNVLRLPVAALCLAPLSNQVRPEDRRYLDPLALSTGNKHTAGEKVELAQKRRSRTVWVQDAEGGLLRAVPVTLGLIERQYAEILSGDLSDEQQVVIGVEADTTTR